MKRIFSVNFIFILSSFLLIAGTIAGCARGLSLQYGGGERPAPEGTLTLYDTGPITLDPAVSQEMRSHFYVVHIFSGLVSLDENMKVVPDLASRWEVSEDDKVYTFYIRPDAKFQNGRPIKAEDIKYSWERAASPATQSPTAETYLGQISGVDEVLQGKAKEIKGVTILNDYTLRVELKEPKASFLPRITYPVAFVVDKDDVNRGGEWWRKPNGSGPFKLKQWKTDELLVLEANDLYYGEAPFLKQVVFRLYAGVPLRMYEQNEIDATDVSIANIDLVRDVSNPFHKELSIYPELSMYYIAFNVTKPPFDDANVRKAFVQAIDKEKIIRLALKGTVRPANGIVPVGMPGFNPELKGLSYDVQAARELLAKSKYGNAANIPPIILTTSGQGAVISDYLSAIIQQWRQNLGVDIQVRELDPEVFFYKAKEVVDNIYDFGWVADYPDPENFLDILFHSNRANNAGRYSNPRVDSLLDTAAKERNEGKRIELYRTAETIAVEDAALLPLWFGQNFILVKPGIQNYKYSPLGFPVLNKVYIGLPATPAPIPTPIPAPEITPAFTPGPAPLPEITPAPSPISRPVVTPSFVPIPGPDSAPVASATGLTPVVVGLIIILVLIAAGIIIYFVARNKNKPPAPPV